MNLNRTYWVGASATLPEAGNSWAVLFAPRSGTERASYVGGFSLKVILLWLALAALFLQAATLVASPAPTADPGIGNTQGLRNMAQQLFVLGNQARAAQGAKPLAWDSALAAAALTHCEEMAEKGQLSHQYAGEADVDVRAEQAGAHFSLIEENVAEGSSPATIHEEWMNSPHHRDNLLSPQVDRVGVAVVARGGMLFAVADFEQAVMVLSPEQVEAAVGQLLATNGVGVFADPAAARAACAMDHGMPASLGNARPEFIMRWQAAKISRLPDQLLERMATGKYPMAAVGSCPAGAGESAFTSYRVAVILLRPLAANSRTVASR